jgi:23S rRNA (uridine2552-2'-O)-methyltransferase
MAYDHHDRYYKKAKQQGYRSRAAYKLLELQERYRFLHPGDSVVDLGAAPGGWLQVAAKIVGANGKIVGVDLQAIEPFQLLSGPADCVLCDLAPKLSGIRDADMARCFELNQIALSTVVDLLRPGGALLIKSFISEDLHAFTAAMKRYFLNVQRTKPEATRQGSSEFYFVGLGYSPNSLRTRS